MVATEQKHFSKELTNMIVGQSKKLKMSFGQLAEKYKTDLKKCREYSDARIAESKRKIVTLEEIQKAAQQEYDKIIEQGKYKGIEMFLRPVTEAKNKIMKLEEDIVGEEKELMKIEMKISERVSCAEMMQNANAQPSKKRTQATKTISSSSESSPSSDSSSSSSSSTSEGGEEPEVSEETSKSSTRSSSTGKTRLVRRSRQKSK